MTTTEQRLEDALRDLYRLSSHNKKLQGDILLVNAREALAAYDAQQAVTPSGGAWRAEDYAVSSGEVGVCIKEGDDTVLDLPFMPAWPESTQRARAARIVQRVNAHDALVSALRDVIEKPGLPAAEIRLRARDALAAAGVTP